MSVGMVRRPAATVIARSSQAEPAARRYLRRCGSRLCHALFILSVLEATVPTALAKCPNYCSQRGVCTGPGDDAFCICEHGYQGDDCGIRECGRVFALLDTIQDRSRRPLLELSETQDRISQQGAMSYQPSYLLCFAAALP